MLRRTTRLLLGFAAICLVAAAECGAADAQKPVQWSFRNDVQPVLAKSGCNAGACHGAAAGQNGFKLSLRGYDNEGDYLALTRQAFGRRVNPTDPARSLMLLKPTTAVPHKGGKRFETNSIDYKILSEWIAEGAPPPRDSDPRIQKLEMFPESVLLEPGQGIKLTVRATFSDGGVKDVTHWAKFTAANATVTQVDDDGQVKVIGNGEGAITAWYLSRIAVATITAPFTNQVSPRLFSRAPRRNFIDDMALEKLRSLNIPPSPRCTDAEFVRRAFIDTIGVLPTEEETRRFLADKSKRKRDRLIETLLNRPEFVDYWSYKWSDLLLVSDKKLRPAAVWSYYDWIRGNVAANTPWDKFVRQVLTVTGDTLQNGAANFYILHDDPRTLSETASQAFLGMSIACAKCHNHPLEKWTNDQYYQMANLFARVRVKSGQRDGENIVFTVTDGDLVQPLRGKPQPPAPLDSPPLRMDSPEDRRIALANWLVSPDNPYFSRAIVNRIWANFFGVGLVEKVDDLRATNPASNEKLLSAAANYLAVHKFDLKSLMRAILQSETYQRSSKPLPENEADTRFYSRYYPRRLMAEVMLDAISRVTGVSTPFDRPDGSKFPAGWRAMQMPDVSADSYFLKTFGRPERATTCECERNADPSMTQVLDLSNGDTINKKLRARDCRISRWMQSSATPDQIIEHAYLSAFSRFPTKDERAKLAKIIQASPDRRAAVEDMYWAILSSKEFLFNH
ncbi:MAG TPA: DUF1549 and DUF1553 domain-containing protein [Verrucomicrobiae bacterium]|nr:DUF1549 and DUF1553 domain-containing protein [Verrucomicrobiae bacterium]